MEIERFDFLDDVLPEDFLELGDGGVIKNLKELVDVLERMDDEDFSLHVYRDHNDFAEWVLEAYWDENLVARILGAKSRKKLVKVLKRALSEAKKGRGLKIKRRLKKGQVLRDIGDLG